MKTNRRGFLQMLGVGGAAAVAAPAIPAVAKATVKGLDKHEIAQQALAQMPSETHGKKERFIPQAGSIDRTQEYRYNEWTALVTPSRTGVYIAPGQEGTLWGLYYGQWLLIYQVSKAGAHVWLDKPYEALRLDRLDESEVMSLKH